MRRARGELAGDGRAAYTGVFPDRLALARLWDVAGRSPRQRREILYRGRVQGVGFRYTVRQIASRWDVDGFVRNLPDGRVQLVAEGTADVLDQFLADVAEALNPYIQDSHVDTSPATSEFRDFEIRH